MKSGRRCIWQVCYVGLVSFVYVFLFFNARSSINSTHDLAVKANALVDHLAAKQFQDAVKDFDAVMTAALPPEKLATVWESLIAQCGPFRQRGEAQYEELGTYRVVYVTCEFQKTAIEAKVVFSVEEKITGLFFILKQTTHVYQNPDYADLDAFTETGVSVGHDPWALPGTLTVPKGNGPFPAIALVHGSGPNDRDESIAANKPFRDLAYGLASRGIAVLRYDKRTKVHGSRMDTAITVKEETIDDALFAVDLLRETGRIDDSRIYVLGHSLGGMLIPRIGAQDARIAGFVVLGGTTRPLEEVVIEQYTYLFSLDGAIDESEQKELDKVKQQAARVKDPNLSLDTPAADLLFGVSASYWLDLRDYHPAQSAKNLKQPMLILQGGRDYQVTVDDFMGWKNALQDRENVTFRIYPKLNHLFIAGEGAGLSTPSEYEIPGHVEKAVIDDIADWIESHLMKGRQWNDL